MMPGGSERGGMVGTIAAAMLVGLCGIAHADEGFAANKNYVVQYISTHPTVYVRLTFPTERYDTAGNYDASTSLWHPPAGLVQISGQVWIQVGAATAPQATYVAKIVRDPTFHADGTWASESGDVCAGIGYIGDIHGTAVMPFNCMDQTDGTHTYGLIVYADCFSACTIDANPAHTYLQGQWSAR